MRSSPRALLTAALLAGCAPAGEIPPIHAPTTGAAGDTSAAPAPPLTPSATPPAAAMEACTRPGAQFPGGKQAPRAFTPAEEKQVAEAEAYVRDHGSPQDARGKAALGEHRYALARASFEARHWPEAAAGFREVAMAHADAEVGIYASQLYLESINVLAQAEPPRPACYDDMAHDVPIFLDLYCQGRRAVDNREQCLILGKIQRDIHRLTAQKLVERADRGEGDAAALYEKAGVAYLALARRCIEDARAAGAKPESERCDEVAYNAAKAFLAAHVPARAEEAAKILLDPRNGMHERPLAAKIKKTMESVAERR